MSDRKFSNHVRLLAQIEDGGSGEVIVKRNGHEYYAYVGAFPPLRQQKKACPQILDVTEPEKPKVITRISSPGYKVRIRGEMMYLNGGVRYETESDYCYRMGTSTKTREIPGLRIFDVSDPYNPEEVGLFQTWGGGVHRHWISPETGLAFLPTEIEGYLGGILVIVDVSNPQRPKEVSRFWLNGQWTAGGEKPPWEREAYWVMCHGPPIHYKNRLYAGWWHAGFTIVDVSDLKNPRLINITNWPTYGGCLHTALPVARKIMDRDWLIVNAEATEFMGCTYPVQEEKVGAKRVWMVDITDETNPVPVSTYFPPTRGLPPARYRPPVYRVGPHQPFDEDLNFTDNLLHLACFGAGIRIVNISDPYRLEEVGYYVPEQPTQVDDCYVDDRGLIYATDRLTGRLYILEYTGPRF